MDKESGVKLREEFEVSQPVGAVWAFIDQPELTARCVPGIERFTIINSDEVDVWVTQSVGPMTATFAARVAITERMPEKLIAFTVTGKSVRGAVGNIRSAVAVQLEPAGEGTTVLVEGDVVLAGALGSVGQKVIAKQARRVAGQFAGNLERALGGEGAKAADGTSSQRAITLLGRAESPPPDRLTTTGDPWSKVAALLSAVSVVVSIVGLRQGRRSTRMGWRR